MDFCLSLYISCNLESRKYLHEINLQQASRPLGLIWESRFPSNLCKFSSLCTHLIMLSEFLLRFIVIVMYYIYLAIPILYFKGLVKEPSHLALFQHRVQIFEWIENVYNFIRTIITFLLKFILLSFIAIFIFNFSLENLRLTIWYMIHI